MTTVPLADKKARKRIVDRETGGPALCLRRPSSLPLLLPLYCFLFTASVCRSGRRPCCGESQSRKVQKRLRRERQEPQRAQRRWFIVYSRTCFRFSLACFACLRVLCVTAFRWRTPWRIPFFIAVGVSVGEGEVPASTLARNPPIALAGKRSCHDY